MSSSAIYRNRIFFLLSENARRKFSLVFNKDVDDFDCEHLAELLMGQDGGCELFKRHLQWEDGVGGEGVNMGIVKGLPCSWLHLLSYKIIITAHETLENGLNMVLRRFPHQYLFITFPYAIISRPGRSQGLLYKQPRD